MPTLTITGGIPLHGDVPVGGSKNAVLPMMAAAILAREPVELRGAPRVADVDTLGQVLNALGISVSRTADGLRLETVATTPVRAPYRLVRRMRASFCVLGPLLARRGAAAVPLPGGCRLGDRPVDLHLAGLAALGAELRLQRGYVLARARRLQGTTIDLAGPRGPTVTGTANLLAAAATARGTTVLRGAAREPEIVDLGNFLNALGARIEGLGDSTLVVRGVEELGGTTYRVIPDRIEAATFLLAAAVTRGAVAATGVVPGHLAAVLEKLRATGARIDVGSDRIALRADDAPRPVDIAAEPYPGVPSDVQPQWTALMALARGQSTVGDRVFPGRFQHAAELQRMGARIEFGDGSVRVTGVDRLSGAAVTATDLRAAAALLLAGLAAAGRTVVRRAGHLRRGYESLDGKLRQLGAQIGEPLSRT